MIWIQCANEKIENNHHYIMITPMLGCSYMTSSFSELGEIHLIFCHVHASDTMHFFYSLRLLDTINELPLSALCKTFQKTDEIIFMVKFFESSREHFFW